MMDILVVTKSKDGSNFISQDFDNLCKKFKEKKEILPELTDRI